MSRDESLDGAGPSEAAERTTEAIAPTTEWAPDGAPCAACGTVVERRWDRDGSLVCAECTDWTVEE